jgi:hypothetical protein
MGALRDEVLDQHHNSPATNHLVILSAAKDLFIWPPSAPAVSPAAAPKLFLLLQR